jgi:3-dehydroquinate synthase
VFELTLRLARHDTRLWLGRDGAPILAADLARRPRPRMLLTDNQVARARARQLEDLVEGSDLHRLVLPTGEASKNSANLLTVLAEMGSLGLERHSPLVAFGGGVIGDLGGLAASLWKRGVPLILVPTSLLAMVDACLGGKTAINFGGLRNAVGTFWPACLVVVDLDCLDTLPAREWAGGFGELLKAAWLSDGSWASRLEQDPAGLLRAGHPDLAGHLKRALRVKAALVEGDEFEAGERALLNLGHSFAHALEARGDGELGHGQAVLFGMLAAARASRLTGAAPPAAADEMEERLRRVLASLGLLPARKLVRLSVANLMKAMTQDKKVREGRLRLVLPETPGRARLQDVAGETVAEAWRQWKDLVR